MIGNELFYAMLYLSYFTSGPLYMFVILAVVCFPVAVLKSAIACLQVFLDLDNIYHILHCVPGIFGRSQPCWNRLEGERGDQERVKWQIKRVLKLNITKTKNLM